MDKCVAEFIKKVCEKEKICRFAVYSEEERDVLLDYFEAIDIKWREGQEPKKWQIPYSLPYTFKIREAGLCMDSVILGGSVSWPDLIKLVAKK